MVMNMTMMMTHRDAGARKGEAELLGQRLSAVPVPHDQGQAVAAAREVTRHNAPDAPFAMRNSVHETAVSYGGGENDGEEVDSCGERIRSASACQAGTWPSTPSRIRWRGTEKRKRRASAEERRGKR